MATINLSHYLEQVSKIMCYLVIFTISPFLIFNFFHQIDSSKTYRQGDLLAAWLSYRHPHAQSKKLRIQNMENTVSRMLDPPYDELTIYHLKCLYALHDGDIYEAFLNQYALTQAFVKVFQSQKEQNWMLKVMQTVCLELRLLAGPADKQANNKKHPIECLEKTAECLMSCFRICAADK